MSDIVRFVQIEICIWPTYTLKIVIQNKLDLIIMMSRQYRLG